MSNWTVALHPLAEPELLALPADMQARFMEIAQAEEFDISLQEDTMYRRCRRLGRHHRG